MWIKVVDSTLEDEDRFVNVDHIIEVTLRKVTTEGETTYAVDTLTAAPHQPMRRLGVFETSKEAQDFVSRFVQLPKEKPIPFVV